MLKGSGDFSPEDPIHPEDFCIDKECEFWDWEKQECKEGHDVRDCIESALQDPRIP